MNAMNALIDDLVEDFRTDFLQARADLVAARLEQQAKDTPAHRAVVTEQRARIDAVLDFYLELSAGRDRARDQRPTLSTVSVPSSRLLT